MDKTRYDCRGSDHPHDGILYLMTLIIMDNGYTLDIGYEVVKSPHAVPLI